MNVPSAVVHVSAYGAVPPETAALADPVQSPKHTLSTVPTFTSSTGGSVMVKVYVVSQPLSSEIVTFQSPAQSAKTLSVPCPGPGSGNQR